MPKSKRNTREYNYTHTWERMLERYDYSISEAMYDRMCKLADEAAVYTDEGHQTIRLITYCGGTVVVVRDEQSGRIKTVLPKADFI